MNCRFYEVLFLQQVKVELVQMLQKMKSGCGPSLMSTIWGIGKLLEANIEEGYVVGKDSGMVHNTLGTIARNGIRLSLNYPKWDDIPSSDNTTFPDTAKDDIIEFLIKDHNAQVLEEVRIEVIKEQIF
ncbi:hypothetical protein M9H77_03373 [Catharanthus roseus]|uniref:Uncharacterized protein n=1 Tax=Catharanthus roseus TaxID=4058 RepID=A0ACC0CB40_CATRO|nr:hypothetical protein M9H77_03373 [Catharanthus roseus]